VLAAQHARMASSFGRLGDFLARAPIHDDPSSQRLAESDLDVDRVARSRAGEWLEGECVDPDRDGRLRLDEVGQVRSRGATSVAVTMRVEGSITRYDASVTG
jgi:hypothetical protein